MAELTAAEKAVFHIVRRVQSDANFSWHMMGTESLALCFKAVAKFKGRSVASIRKRIENNAASVKETPEIVQLREQVQKLDKQLEELLELDSFNNEESQSDRIIREVTQLLWQHDCGVPLSIDKLRAALEGRSTANLI